MPDAWRGKDAHYLRILQRPKEVVGKAEEETF